MSFTVAIIGRPNVGKSTLFNRLAGRPLALIDDTPGVTRDRREGYGRIADLTFRLIDTAGLEEAAPETLSGRMRAQTESALGQADVALLLIDARAGLTPLDRHFARWLRRGGKPVVCATGEVPQTLPLQASPPLPPRIMPLWQLAGDGVSLPEPIAAYTAGEARAKLKAMLGLRRLPVGTRLEKVNG